jgi:Carboxypeptidase regulatory-like domain
LEEEQMSFATYFIKHAGSRLSRFSISTVLMLCACLCLAGGYAHAQDSGQGTVSGTVTDPSGAVIVGAQVTVTNTATNVSHSRDTNSTGYFEVDNLNPGPYAISVAAPKFTKLVRQGITLDTGARLNIPLQLKPGAVDQTVTISADAALLNTESASVGQVLSTREVEDLTVSGNNPTWLALIAPGVQSTASQAASTGDGGGLIWQGLTQDFGNFGRIGHNDFRLDGAPNETSGNQAGMNQAPDAVGEMKIDVTGYDAAIGHTLGVAVSSTTKAGTNTLHGAVRETYSDTRWQALNHFTGLNYRYQQSLAGCTDGAATSPACYALENKYGNAGTNANNGDVAVGGPVYIPKIVDGRNKVFFFFSGIIDNFAGVGTGSGTLPTAQEMTGNFNDLPSNATVPNGFLAGSTYTSPKGVTIAGTCPTGTTYYGQYQLYNPFSVQIDSSGTPRRTPFCGNQVPASYLTNSAMVQFYNKALPAPNVVNPGAANYIYSQITPQTLRDYTTREDWKFSEKDDIFVRYTWQRYTKTTNSLLVDNLGREAEGRHIQLAAIGWNHIFNDRTNLNISFGGTQYKNTCCNYPGYDALSPGTFGLPGYTSAYAQGTPAYSELPVLAFTSSYTGMGFYNSGQIPNTTRDFALSGDLTRVQGHHTIRAGAEWRMQNYAQQVSGNVSGTYTFDDTYTQENNGSDTNFASPNNFGLSYGAFLMGINTSNSVTQQASQSFQSPYYAVYGTDIWRVTPKLTIIPGIRFELEQGLVEKHNQLVVGWNPTANLSAISGPANTAYAATVAGAPAAVQAILPASLTIQGGPQYAGVNGSPRNAYANSYRFLPRFGATYQVNHRVLVRAGFGLYYDTMNAVSPQYNQDGFSASTSVNTSTSFGTNFSAGNSPLTDPFPANAAGSRFTAPTGSSAGSYYYLGASPTDLYDHSITPAREYRGSIGTQIQLSQSTMVDISFNIARTNHILIGKSSTFTPASFYIGGQQPNSATASLLGTLVSNPFNISNLNGLAGSNPAAYSIISHSTYYTGSQTSVGNLIRAYPQMGGFSENEPLGKSDFQEFLFHVTHRLSHGLTLMGSFEVNDQHDADYFNNAYDPLPSFEASNSSTPTRLTIEEVWALPFGRGRQWANKGWESAVFGGFQINSSYEAAPGTLISFGNLFYIGTPDAGQIKLKHPVYSYAGNGNYYVQWLNPATVATATISGGVCTYSGTGFVTNSQCQPNSYNQRVFPTRINGVRAMGQNNVNGNVSRNFHLVERLNLETSMQVFNVFNHQGLSAPNASPTNSNFGRVTGSGFPNASARWVSIQGRLRF